MNESPVQLGVLFPARDIGSDRDHLLSFAPSVEAIEELDFVVVYDHITAVSPEQDSASLDVSRNFARSDPWHEPLTLLAAMAARTERLALITGCLIAPQRPTALIAQQAAEVDVISDGRLILGVAVGWNETESAALGYNPRTRAARLEAQIGLLRRLWAGEQVSGSAQNELFDHTSISLRPIQQPVPIWMGGLSTAALERAVRLADGWIPLDYLDVAMGLRLARLRQLTEEAGRSDMQILGRINPWRDSYSKCVDSYKRWVDGGATHVAIGTSKGCFRDSEQYFGDLARFVNFLLSRLD